MRILSFAHDGKPSFGLFTDDGIIDAGARLPYSDLRSLIAAAGVEALRELQGEKADYAADDIVYRPVIPNAPRVFCVGINYFEHMQEGGREPPEHPWIFLRNNASLRGHLQPLEAPAESECYDYEAELCAVIGTSGRRIGEDDALNHVFGYTAFNDGSIRDFQRLTPLWTPGKNFDATGAVGPWIVPADEVDANFELPIRSRLNGETMQDDVVNRWHFSLAQVIAFISSWTELQPGDLIATGTPSGVGFARTPPVWMKPGDTIEIDIDGVATLRNPIVAG